MTDGTCWTSATYNILVWVNEYPEPMLFAFAQYGNGIVNELLIIQTSVNWIGVIVISVMI